MPVLGRQTYRRGAGARAIRRPRSSTPDGARQGGRRRDRAPPMPPRSRSPASSSTARARRALGDQRRGSSAYHAWTSCGMSCTARTPDGTGSGWAGASVDTAPADLDAAALAKIAVDKATSSAKPPQARARPLHRRPRAGGGREPARVPDRLARRAARRRGPLVLREDRRRHARRREAVPRRDHAAQRSDRRRSSAAPPFDGEGLPLAADDVDRQGHADRR